MFEISKMEFISSYICELNSYDDSPIISNYYIDQDDSTSLTFIENTIYNFLNSADMKWSYFIEEDEMCSKAYKSIVEIRENLSSFKEKSMEIIKEYFNLIKDNSGVSPGNIIVYHTLHFLSTIIKLCSFQM